jgi:hypothetical protein
MTTTVYRGIVKDGAVVLENDVRLRDGAEVLVTPVAATAGTPAALLDALKTAPPVPSEWVDELEQLISEGRRLQSRPQVFEEVPSGREQI